MYMWIIVNVKLITKSQFEIEYLIKNKNLIEL